MLDEHVRAEVHFEIPVHATQVSALLYPPATLWKPEAQAEQRDVVEEPQVKVPLQSDTAAQAVQIRFPAVEHPWLSNVAPVHAERQVEHESFVPWVKNDPD